MPANAPTAQVHQRLGALATAAAMAVIVVCGAALAMLTGLLDLPPGLRRDAAVPLVRPAALPFSPSVVAAQSRPDASPNARPPVDVVPPEAIEPASTAQAATVQRPAAPHLATTTAPRHPATRRRMVVNKPASHAKTREQVAAEVIRSKRDGTYPANNEIYR